MYKIKGADDKEYGPATAEQVRQWIAERRANSQTLIQVEGSLTWQPLSSLLEFSEALQRVGPPPAPPSLPVLSPLGPSVPKTNPMAVTGVVMGGLSLAGGWLCCCGFPFAILGIIFSALAWHQIKKDPLAGSLRMAQIGLLLSILGLFAGIILHFIFSLLSKGSSSRWLSHW